MGPKVRGPQRTSVHMIGADDHGLATQKRLKIAVKRRFEAKIFFACAARCKGPAARGPEIGYPSGVQHTRQRPEGSHYPVRPLRQGAWRVLWEFTATHAKTMLNHGNLGWALPQ